MKSEPSRTFIGSVLCVDLVGYSKRTVDEQIAVKSAFNRLLSQVIKAVRPDDRIILDTGDGAAVSFLGDPDECLKVGLELRDRLVEASDSLGSRPGEGPVRIGMHMGPLRVAVDMNGHPNIIGDGLNAAERVMGFAQPGQIVASRGFHEMVSRLSAENGAMFRYEGKHTDKNAREHEIYIVEDRRRVRRAAAALTAARKAQGLPEIPEARGEPPQARPEAPQSGAEPPQASPEPAAAPQPARTPAAPVRPIVEKAPAPAPVAPPRDEPPAVAHDSALAAFLRSPAKVWTTGIALMALIFAEAWMLDRKLDSRGAQVAATSPAPVAPAAATQQSAGAQSPVAPKPVETKAEERKPVPVAPKPVETKAAEARPAPVESRPLAVVPKPVDTKAAEAKPAPVESRPLAVVPKPVDTKAAEAKPVPVERKPEPAPATVPSAVVPKADNTAAKAERPKADAAPPKTVRAKSEPEPRRYEDPRVAAAKPAPTVAPPQADPVPPPSTAAPPPAAPAPAPAPVQVASAATPITRVPVQFPRAAERQGIATGLVRARLAINPEGRVTHVTILGSSSQLFDREAIRALEEWRFNAGTGPRTYEVEIEFKR